MRSRLHASCGADARSPTASRPASVPAPRSASRSAPSTLSRSSSTPTSRPLLRFAFRGACPAPISTVTTGTFLQSHGPNPTKQQADQPAGPRANPRFNPLQFSFTEAAPRPVIVSSERVPPASARTGQCRIRASRGVQGFRCPAACLAFVQPTTRAYNAVAAPYDAFRGAQEQVIPQRLGTVQQSLRGSPVAAAILLRRQAAAAP